MRWLILALAVLIGASAPSPEKFDLVCKGKYRQNSSRAWEPYEVRYRIDLARRTYCNFDCKTVNAIPEVTDGKITFQKTGSEIYAPFISHYVDRSSGHWEYNITSMIEANGTCEPATFSGFPEPKF